MTEREVQIFFTENVEMVQTVLWDEHKEDLAQIIFGFAVSLEGSLSFLELVEEHHGQNGRELVAKEAIDLPLHLCRRYTSCRRRMNY